MAEVNLKTTIKYSLGSFFVVVWNSGWPMNLLILNLVWAKTENKKKKFVEAKRKKERRPVRSLDSVKAPSAAWWCKQEQSPPHRWVQTVGLCKSNKKPMADQWVQAGWFSLC